EPTLAESPVAQCKRCLRRVAVAPMLAREAPAQLRLGAADLPRLGIPAQEPGAAENARVLGSLDHEHAEAPGVPALEPAVDRLLGAGEIRRRPVADVAHRLGIGERRPKTRPVLVLRLADQQALAPYHRVCSQPVSGP